MREPLSILTKAEAAYREIRGRILRGALEPASTINQEGLAAELGLSVTPLREALRRLETEGLVELAVHRTVRIAPLTRRELHEIYAVRLQLDPFAASIAAATATEAELEEIGRQANQAPLDDPVLQLEANRAFHRAVYASSGNRVLTETLDQLWDWTDRYRLVLLRRGVHGPTAIKEHIEIATAIKRRNAQRAAALTRTHVDAAQVAIEQLANVL